MPNKWPSRLKTANANSGSIGRYAVRAMAFLGGGAALWGFFFSTPVNTVVPAREAVNTAAVASSFAQKCVAAWLTATASAHSELSHCTTISPDVKLPATAAAVIDAPTFVAIDWSGTAGENNSATMFSVTIGVSERPYASAAPTQAFYRVPVEWTKQGPWMPSMPSRVAGPGAGAILPTAYPMNIGANDPLYNLISGFLTAYLTDKGGVDRFVTSQSGLLGLGGVYREVTLTNLAASTMPKPAAKDGEKLRVLAQVRATTSQFAPVLQSYPLTLAYTSGKWSVAQIDRVPVMSSDTAPVPILPAASPK